MTSLAHVSYTVDPAKLEALAGSDWGFVLSPLSDPLYLTLIVITLVVSVVGFVVGETFAPIRDYCRAIHDRLLEYRNHVPFFLRLALAVALIISGTRQFIFLPNVPGAGIGNLEIFLGFSILVGFMVRVSALAVLGVYIYGLVTSHYLLGTMESAAAALVVAAYGAKTGPSIDGILGVDVLGKMCERMWNHICENTGPIIRVALGFTLMWLAVTEKAMNPRVCEAVVIDFDLQNVIPVTAAMWVFTVGVIELAVGLVLVLGFYTRTFSIIAFLVLTLSFFYFREEVAGHVTFFAALTVLMITGAGRYSIDAWIARIRRNIQGTAEPYAITATAA